MPASNAIESPQIKVWSLDPLTTQQTRVIDLLYLLGGFQKQIDIIPFNGGKNVLIYAEDPVVAAKLEEWVIEHVPNANYRMCHLDNILP